MPDIRELTISDIKDIYHRYMKKDFPPGELRPYHAMESLYKDGRYLGFGFFEGDELLAYACLIFGKDREYAMLDLFAVIPELRDKGIGSTFLKELAPLIPVKNGTFIEAESPETAKDEEERKIRQKRIAFYTRNGVCVSDSRCLLFHVDYNILFLPKTDKVMSGEEFFEAVSSFYRELYSKAPDHFCRPYRAE